MTDLKPCPLCSGHASFERLGNRLQSCIVVCDDCGCMVESNEVGNFCGQKWNSRHAVGVDLSKLERCTGAGVNATLGDYVRFSDLQALQPKGVSIPTMDELKEKIQHNVMNCLMTDGYGPDAIAPITAEAIHALLIERMGRGAV